MKFPCSAALIAFMAAAMGVTGAAAQRPEVFTYPAEFEPQAAVWIGARPEENGRPTLPAVVQMAQALAPHVAINFVVPGASVEGRLRGLLRKASVNLDRVRFVTITSSPTQWYRDIGPIFLKGSRGHLKIVDFDFNCYGDCEVGSPEAEAKEGIDRQIAGMLHLPVVRTTLVSEGGDREVNGRGTLMAVEAVETQRNPRLTRDQIGRELMRILGQKKIVWLKRGVAEDDDAQQGAVRDGVYAAGAGGHIDEMARFASPNTILLEQVSPSERDSDPVMRVSYERLEENLRILKSATDQDGRPFRIVRMPAADPLYVTYAFNTGDSGLTFFRGAKPGRPIRVIVPRSYMNFVISNGVVLVARYWRAGRSAGTLRKDRMAKRILQTVFPGRQIVQIDAETLNFGGGGMHCATQQEPAVP